MAPGPGPVSWTFEDPDPALSLHTGYRDDRREKIPVGDRRYAIFARALTDQDGWTDDEHRDFWMDHLAIWRATAGQRPNRARRASIAPVPQRWSASFATALPAGR